ncbi:hypothetical protein CLV24_11926 [Pontibacter ummariensis]|uniref:Uncharacterized protein n=1 Tax=Pontibacter ummariensis TaxID=1610492 RepID=A0A239IVB9_9BACT|nr:hypothetical protein CLV24_11926 [Pontibacter ummariensis]SNS97475.1 hypothetical protein SAMN06296052_11926 [Pontibacter ummariensis]
MKLIQPLLILLLLAGCQSKDDSTTNSLAREKQPDYTLLRYELEEIYDVDQDIRNVDWDTIATPLRTPTIFKTALYRL